MGETYRSIDKFVPKIWHLMFLFAYKITFIVLFGLFIFGPNYTEGTCYGQEYTNKSGEIIKTVSVQKDPDLANVSIDHRF